MHPTIGSSCCRRKTIPRTPEGSNNFLRSHQERNQGPEWVLASDNAAFGNEDEENIDAVTSTEKLKTLDTSHLLDISGDVIGFLARRRGIYGTTSENVRGEVESVRTASEGTQGCFGSCSA